VLDSVSSIPPPRKPPSHLTRPRILLFTAAVAAAAIGWLLNYLFVADQSRAGLLALPVWLVAGAAVGWLAIRWRERSRDQRLAASRLEGIGAASTDAILQVDADGVVAGWSPGAEALYGYEAEEVIGRPLADLLGDDDADRVVAAIREGERLDDVGEQQTREGDVFTAAITAIPSADPPEAIVVARNVGEVERLTRELRNAEATDRSLREHLPVVTYVRSFEDGKTTFVSPRIDRLVGYTADEWLADPGLFARLVHPDDRDEVLAERDAVDPAKPLRLSYRMLARDGRVVWVREEAVAVLDESGRPLRVQGYLLDVGERKAAEAQAKELRTAEAVTAEEARDRQRKIEFVAEAASVLASSLDVSSTVGEVAVLATRALAEWCVVDVLAEDGSVTRYAVAGAEPTSAATEPAPDPDPAIREVIQNRRPDLSPTHMRLPLASGGRRALGALTFVAGERAAPYEGTDLPWGRAVAGMIALALDNSHLHAEVEARSDANKVLTHVGEGVFLVDRAGVVRLWNPASAAITGVSAEAAVGTAVSDAIPDWHELFDRIPLGTAGEPVRPATLPLETRLGERWISISGVEFISGTVYALRDITEEHRLDELKAEFIATASHELRTPLAAVYGAAQTLRRHDFALDDAGRERFISLIVDESDRLAAIVNQILLANQLEVGRVDLETEPFDGADMVERVVESAKTHAPSHVTFDVQVAEGVPPVAADKDRARQVLVNLVENAVKYSPGGGTIQVGLQAADGSVRFSVVDEGMGIPSHEQARIFEKFYRLDPNLTSGIGGTGLGLYICRELVERMGGSIWLESEEGKGSAFYFQLPSTTARPTLVKLAESERAAG
jgi:PAS domain S-box-containing protein